MPVWTFRLLVVSYACSLRGARGACSQLGLRPHRHFDLLGTVHAVQRQHTSERELFVHEEIRDCTASQAGFADTS